MQEKFELGTDQGLVGIGLTFFGGAGPSIQRRQPGSGFAANADLRVGWRDAQSLLPANDRHDGAPELAVPRKILKVTEVPVLGTGKTDYVAIQRIAETARAA